MIKFGRKKTKSSEKLKEQNDEDDDDDDGDNVKGNIVCVFLYYLSFCIIFITFILSTRMRYFIIEDESCDRSCLYLSACVSAVNIEQFIRYHCLHYFCAVFCAEDVVLVYGNVFI